MNLTLKVWRQASPDDKGRIDTIEANEIPAEASFLEMLDIVNQEILQKGGDPIAFDHDCREGICGTCSLTINGIPHGPQAATTTCQLHMRHFEAGSTIWVEPFRAKAFPILRDLIVDRSAFDRIIQAGGFISVRTGSAQDANCLPIPKATADLAMDSAACIGCGACVATCKNASAMLFVAAKISQLNRLPQGEPERERRALDMVAAMDAEGFGACTNQYECSAVCPKEIDAEHIATLNREYARGTWKQAIR